ncbi:Bug family tripartite tricarboxylate transporter substrate binding protein [Larsenimonas rhizosphaerae]|uniref:Tripartite tricarboxylate transporter substrate-binding protein n=1 Tax=Larsenimonas rhizosphaerae TaxID=2944682 RepID=A0AA41ZNV6_9GAMM|nr:tripartite tricarboxylate transporter substrate-binding protein [Larsenimonas rhizosphaerae]MCM2131268.1 tripartite tricarboxylate transporter substrate-binding protein [Larsenimonas rhizosphaerae]MCX2525373.1 tripartite tricarboxylate transporter substrate-binding protein [Larsenimonas rhizosphaerae]
MHFTVTPSLRFYRRCALAFVLALCPFAASADTTASDEPAIPDTLTWTVPFGVGGGTDVWARFMSHWMAQSLPGTPAIVINNVPGGGSLTGASLFYSRAKDNGEQMLVTSASTQYPAMLKDPRVRFDYDSWTPIVAAPTGGVVYTQPKFGKTTDEILEALRNNPTKFAMQTPTGLEMPVMLAFDMLGLAVEPVFGMRSRGEGRLAFERGEAGVDFQTTSAYFSNVTPLVNDGKAVPLFSLGVMDEDGHIVRDPAFPDLPTFSELYLAREGTSRDDVAYQVFHKFFASGYALQKLLLIPKGVNPDLIARYRQGARTLMSNDDFLAAARKQIGPYKPVVGEVAAKQLAAAMELSDANRQWVIDWLKDRYGVRVLTK